MVEPCERTLRSCLYWACLVSAANALSTDTAVGEVSWCDYSAESASSSSCELNNLKRSLQIGGAHVVDNFLSLEEMTVIEKTVFDGAPTSSNSKLGDSTHLQLHLNSTLIELEAPTIEIDAVVQQIVQRLHRYVDKHVLLDSELTNADAELPWSFRGQLYRDYHLLRRYLSSTLEKRKLAVHTDSVTDGRCVSIAVHLADETHVQGGDMRMHRCHPAPSAHGELCQRLYIECRKRDTGHCQDMLDERGLVTTALVPYKRGRAVFFLSETLHDVSELRSGDRDLLFTWLSCSPTLRVIHNGNVDTVEQALRNGASLDEEDREGLSPMHWIASDNFSHMAKLLYRHGGDPNVRGFRQNSPHLQQEVPLHVAAEHGHANIVEVLVELRADVSRQMQDGSQPLHQATERGHAVLVGTFVSLRADVAASRRDGDQALHIAAGTGHLDVASTLLSMRSNVNEFGAGGSQPLHLAATTGRIEVVKHLLNAKATPNSGTIDDRITAVHFAAQEGHSDVIRLILAGVGTPSDKLSLVSASALEEHIQPLHLAAGSGHVPAVDALLEFGADSRAAAQDADGVLTLPIDLARNAGHSEVVERLERLDL